MFARQHHQPLSYVHAVVHFENLVDIPVIWQNDQLIIHDAVDLCQPVLVGWRRGRTNSSLVVAYACKAPVPSPLMEAEPTSGTF
jgi:hypothetical protein